MGSTWPTIYSGTLTDVRISSVNSYAFLDNCAALVPYANGRNFIRLFDASGRIIEAYLKAPGAGETLSTTGGPLDNGEYITDPAFDADGSWTKGTGPGDFVALNQTSRYWFGMAVAPNGDVYASVYDGSIYKQTGGTGNFLTLNQTFRRWRSMAAAPNGDVYASVDSGDIYKQTGGTGDFVALGQTSQAWYGMTAAPNGDVYACVFSGGDIYKQTGGTGNFIALNQTYRYWHSMAAAPNGDIYASVYFNGDIYKQTGGVGNFIALNQTTRNWRGMAAAPNGDVYACVSSGDIYKQVGGTGDFIALNQTSRAWYGMTAAPNGDIYASNYNSDIYKQTAGTGWTISDGKAVAATTSGSVYQNATLVPMYALVKGVLVCDALTAGTYAHVIGGVNSTTYTDTGTKTAYATCTSAPVGIDAIVRLSATFTSISQKVVLTPSATGVTLTSTPNGTALDAMTFKDASFVYNAASYKYAIYSTLKVTRGKFMGVSV